MTEGINQQASPPPIPPRPARPVNRRSRDDVAAEAFSEEYHAVEGRITANSTSDALLKRPARVLYELMEGRTLKTVLVLLAITVVCFMGYGLIVGSFSGGHQWWAVPLKVTAGILLSTLICLPSLYIFSCLSGKEMTLLQIAGILLIGLALSAILLVGFAPVAWIFSQSTGTAAIMGMLHIIFLFVGLNFGLRLLKSSFRMLSGKNYITVRNWVLIFMMVVMQMSTALRPLVGEYTGFREQEKKFFVRHWVDSFREALDEMK